MRAAASPKPRLKEFATELRGWSGGLSALAWVSAKYGATAVFLARVDTEMEDPEGWLAVSRLYADHGDGLARFTAQFAAAAHEYRPQGLPNLLGETIRSYQLKVPPAVRAVMCGPARGEVGAVVETEESVYRFLADPSRPRRVYHPLAMRRYASILLAKRPEFADDPGALESFDVALAALRQFGEPDRPRADPTEAQRRHVDELLCAQVRADTRLFDDPYLDEAYLRARNTMLRWAIDGRELDNAAVLYTKLRAARLDGQRAERVVAEHEQPVAEPIAVPASLSEPMDLRRVPDADILRRAAAVVRAVAAPGPDDCADCWEKTTAISILNDGVAQESTSATVVAAWSAQRPSGHRTRPRGAVTASAIAATELVSALLFLGASAVTQTGDLPEVFRDAAAIGRLSRRQAEITNLLYRCGFDIDGDGE
ncbi:hypothetical protein NRB20_32330 [Nocardia sp. RB20]|uniref:Uncharacterized protein n=1 Tax=Nocardia macrotermitis TaxID=2585198 RepID=A0A7K0D3A1_9NOCA|nr:hypothetical protein [Nocardia macrotermitis]